MTTRDFPGGVLRPELCLGTVSTVAASHVLVQLSLAGRVSASHYQGARYGRGEVGEFVLVEGQQSLLLGRITEVALPDGKWAGGALDYVDRAELKAQGRVQLLGGIGMHDLRITAGVESYPRIGDRVFAAPYRYLAELPLLMAGGGEGSRVALKIGKINGLADSEVSVRPEKLFGRHCAILGTTGGGKSWTTARLVGECIKHQAKIILIDATGEYRGFGGPHVTHCHLGEQVNRENRSRSVQLPPTSFTESDFIALFEPSGKVQGPKLRAAIRSLRLAKLCQEHAKGGSLLERLYQENARNGYIEKIGKSKVTVEEAEQDPELAAKLDDPNQPFDPFLLVKQIEQECVYPEGFGQQKGQKDPSKWGDADGNFSHCLSLVARINGVLQSPAFRPVFKAKESSASVTEEIDRFIEESGRLLRICLSGVGYEFKAREIIANAIGRYLLTKARKGGFKDSPVLVIVDEAHNFLGRQIGAEDCVAKLDAFEIIAKEGRKYGLNICLATQRPRDITEGVLSQMGTLIVHRLVNDHDRQVVERASGEIDRSAASFIPNLQPGEAVIIGVDFPIPLTVRIGKPEVHPLSDGPNYQQAWSKT